MTGQRDATYAAWKVAVAHLGPQFAREWVRQEINVNTIQPGYIRTELVGDWFDTAPGNKQIASWRRSRLMGIGSLDERALYIYSDPSLKMAGATITIDDGQSL